MASHSDLVLVVEADLAGIMLGDFLARELPAGSPLQVRHVIDAGQVRVNGEACLSSRRLRSGDVVQVPAGRLSKPAPRPATSLPEILFESPSVLVVQKPAGVPTVPDRSGRERGVHGLLPQLRPDGDLRIVHRLDRDTSGCLLLAKGLAAAQHFDEQFRGGLVHKTYLALVHGVPLSSTFAIDAWLGPDRRRPGKVVASATEQEGFRAAHTEVQLRQAFRRHALLELRPSTGRGHQLRVHLQSVGHAIVGDVDYGGEPLLLSSLKSGYKIRRGVVERPLADRLFLHSERVGFQDLDGHAVAVEAPLPADLTLLLQKLESFDERRR